MSKEVQAPASMQNTILHSTAMPRGNEGKFYTSEQFKREICRAVQALCLPGSTTLPIGLHMIIKQAGSSISLKLVRTSRGWFTEKDMEANEP